MRGLVLLLGMGGLLPMAIATPMVGVIAYYWISLMSPQMEVWGIAAVPPWALLSALATLLGCLVAREPKRLPRNAMIWLVILFLILTTISSLFALGPRELVLRQWSEVAKELVFVLVLAGLLTERHRIHALLWIMVISLGFYGVAGGLFAIVTGGRFHVFGPPDSIIGDNNMLAVALLMTLPLMNYLRLQSAHSVIRKGLMAAMVLTLFSIFASYSRGAFLGLAAVTVVFWWRSRHKLVTAVVMAVALFGAFTFMPASWTARMDTIVHYKQDASAQERLTVWHEALGIAHARPFTGGGYHSTSIASVLHQFYPGARPLAVHDIWLEVLSENGFPAFFVWLGMLLLGFLNIRRIRRLARGDPTLAWAEDLARMSQVTLIAFVTAGSFLSMGYYDFTWALLVTLAATREIIARAPKAVSAESDVRTPAPTFSPAFALSSRPASGPRPGAIPAWRLRRLSR